MSLKKTDFRPDLKSFEEQMKVRYYPPRATIASSNYFFSSPQIFNIKAAEGGTFKHIPGISPAHVRAVSPLQKYFQRRTGIDVDPKYVLSLSFTPLL